MAKESAFWITDSGGVESLHRNAAGLSFEESYLGEIRRKDGVWQFVWKGGEIEGPFDTYAQAKREGMRLCNVEYV